MKRQPSEWEKILADEVTDKSISKIDKQLIQLFSCLLKKNDPIKKWAEDLTTHFSKEVIQMAKMHMKRCSASLFFRERQNKTTVRHHLTPLRKSKMIHQKQIIKKSIKRLMLERMWKKGTLLHCWWKCKLMQPL